MAYIGKDPADSFISFVKQDFSVSATTSYTLDNAVTNQNEIALFINHVRQEPTTAYTASGTSLTLTSATASGDDMYCIYLGMAKQTVNAPDGSVGSSQVASTIITGQTAETSIADADTILIHDDSTTALRKMTKANFVAGVGETNKPAFYATRSSAQSISNNTYTKLEVNTEVVDTNSAYDNSSNYRFTVPSGEAGLYSFTARSSLANVNDDQRGQIVLAVNGTRDSKTMHRDYSTGTDQALYVGTTGIFNLSVGDYVEVFVLQNSGGTENADNNMFAGYKICTV